jgi:ABC-type oligopeptide transport system ATPase subunit
VLYQGRDLHALSADEYRAFRRDVQAIFQDPYGVYNPFYRVDHVLTTPVAKFRLAKTKPEARALIEDALRAVGLRPEEILGRFPHQLSGGQRQRVMVARALLLRPHLIVADEPVSMVDASLRATILGSLRQLNQERGISIIYTTASLYAIADCLDPAGQHGSRLAERTGSEAAHRGRQCRLQVPRALPGCHADMSSVGAATVSNRIPSLRCLPSLS